MWTGRKRDRIDIRVSRSEAHNFTELARLRGLTLSALVRRRLNAEVEQEKKHTQMLTTMYPQRPKQNEWK
jgi:hypothetical protein